MSNFAKSDDVAVRLMRPLTDAEKAMAEQVIAQVQSLIAEAVGKDDAWATTLNPVPPYFNGLCIEKVLLAMNNPSGLRSKTQSLGAYSESETYPTSDAESGGIDAELTDQEGILVRRIVQGTDSGTAQMGSILDELPDWQDLTTFITPQTDDDDESPATD